MRTASATTSMSVLASWTTAAFAMVLARFTTADVLTSQKAIATVTATSSTSVLCVVEEVLLDAQILQPATMTAKRDATTVLAHTSPMEIAIVKAISLTP